MVKIALVAAWLVMAVPALPHLDAAERAGRHEKQAQARVPPPAPEPWSPLRYDTGLNAAFHPDGMNGANSNRVVGNRFNSALGAPLPFNTNFITGITVFPANSGIQSVSIATAPTTMNTAMVLDYINANLMANAFNMIPVNPQVVVGRDFLVFFVGTYGGYQTMGLLGMSDMQTMNQGYHAVQGFYAGGGLATMIQPVPNRNAMLRVAGAFRLPVELMDFKLE